MTALPSDLYCRPSSGVAVVPFLNGAYAHDRVTNTVHRLGPAAAALLLSDSTSIADFAAELSTGAGIDKKSAELSVRSGVESMRALGLLDRRQPYAEPDPVSGSELPPRDAPTSAAFVAHDKEVVFRSSDRVLLDRVEAALGVGHVHTGEPISTQVVFDVEPQPDGGVTLDATERWEFPDEDGFFFQLPGVINDFAARSNTVPVLHSGGVVTPSGRVLLVCGAVDSGKSTLIAALVQQGCGYLGDELIGIEPATMRALPYPKPFQLDETSLSVLNIGAAHPPNVRHWEVRQGCELLFAPIGPIDEVIVPCYDPASPPGSSALDVEEAARVLLDQTTNLRRVGRPGLSAICALAPQIRVTRIVHADSAALAADLMAADTDGTRHRLLPSHDRG